MKRPKSRTISSSKKVSIPDRDYGFLKPVMRIFGAKDCFPVSIPDRDYGFLKPEPTRAALFGPNSREFQSLIGIMGF